ncbi:unnamed protein product [Symbiodinium natans]|uniref:Pentatricopeptide repeat-containing protein, chloroplastic n=1 Tax=Symbiodinium natans TaxID=878477 RepID=A0A812U7X4_9DINO|nr:unnamed protein product [Symbiodinium natans]
MGTSSTAFSLSGRQRQRKTASSRSRNLGTEEAGDHGDNSWLLALRHLRASARGRVRADVVSFSAAGSACQRAKLWHLSLQILEELRHCSVRADAHSKNVVLSSLTRGRRGWIAAAQLLEDGIVGDLVSYATVMQACASTSPWHQAINLLAQTGARRLGTNNIACTIGLAACKAGRRWEHALKMVEGIASQNVEVEIRTLTATLTSLEPSAWTLALRMCHETATISLRADSVFCCAAMSTCREPWRRALQCLTTLRALGRAGGASLRAGAVAFGTSTKALELNTQWTEALTLLKMLTEEGLRPCAAAGVSACSACGQASLWQRSLCIPLSGAPATVAACSRGDAWCMALATAALEHRPAEVLRVTLNTAISSVGKVGRWQKALRILCQLRFQHAVPDVISHNSVITALRHVWEDALAVLRHLHSHQHEAGLVSFNAALHSLAEGAQWLLSLQLLRGWRQRSSTTSSITCNSLISACENNGHWRAALQVLAELPGLRVFLDEISHNSASSASEKGSQWTVASCLLQASARGMKVDVLSFGSVVAACRTPDRWQVATSVCSEMRAVQVQTDLLTYSAALSALGNAGKWKQAALFQDQGGTMEDLSCNALAWAFAQGERLRRE